MLGRGVFLGMHFHGKLTTIIIIVGGYHDACACHEKCINTPWRNGNIYIS